MPAGGAYAVGMVAGPVEVATEALVKTLGQLSASQAVTAAAAVSVAAALDREPDGSKRAALSRELRQLRALLSPAAGAGGQSDDPVAALQDEVARKRRQREAG